MRENIGCVVGVGKVAAERETPGNNGVLGKDKISRRSKHPRPRRRAKPQQPPLAKACCEMVFSKDNPAAEIVGLALQKNLQFVVVAEVPNRVQ
jgi:hypothetical protein